MKASNNNRGERIMQAQGIAKKIFSKTVKGGKVIHSFVLYDDDNFYSTSFDKPSFNEGDEVRFEYEEDKYGNKVNMASIKSRVAAEKPVVTKGAPAKSVGGRDSYWEEKDRYDKEVKQSLISYQAATNVAKDLAIAALNAGILPTAGSKKADKFESFMDIVREIREDVYSDYYNAAVKLEAGDVLVVQEPQESAEPAIEAADVPAVEEAADKQETETDDWGDVETDDWK